ncbi:hypothetical protein [Bradyrhizobium sp. 188]|uniref:hypothetical protein n=1 Tax=Bradyrhizobium sp. 188 TaxID=2782656 RepID=UPI001FFBAAA4|nr:hypothetical protein [Bradyrhizobium sp. 188]
MTTRWFALFDDPIPLPAGRRLTTLRDAAAYIMDLPKTQQTHKAWQTAAETLLAAAEGRDFVMHARIAVLRAMNRDRPAPARARRETLADRWRARKASASKAL